MVLKSAAYTILPVELKPRVWASAFPVKKLLGVQCPPLSTLWYNPPSALTASKCVVAAGSITRSPKLSIGPGNPASAAAQDDPLFVVREIEI